MVRAFITAIAIALGVIAVPSVAAPTSIEAEQFTWDEFHADAYAEYLNDFDALFNSYETKRAKNGAMMIRVGDSGSFKFAKKG